MTRPLALLMAGVLVLFYLDGFVLGAPLWLLLAFALLGLPVLAGFLHHGDHGPAGRLHPRPVLLAAAAALLVLLLSRGALMSVVSAAALVGCTGGLLERLSRGSGPLRDGAAPIYCGAFAGMTSELVLRHPGWVLLAGALASLLVSLLAPLPLAAVWLGASFVGMTAPERLATHPYRSLVAMGLLFGLFSLGFEPRLAGIGGDLGATAAVSVFAVLGARALLSRMN